MNMEVQELNASILLSASENSMRWSSVPWIRFCWRSSCTAFSEWKRESESLSPLSGCEQEKLASPFPQESYKTESKNYHNMLVISPRLYLKHAVLSARYYWQAGNRGRRILNKVTRRREVGRGNVRKSNNILFLQDWQAIKEQLWYLHIHDS